MKNTILVTGGAGFLGSHLCEKLLFMGDYVICLDNLVTGNMNNIKELLGNPNFEFVEHDVTKEICLNKKVDQIYNLACPASPIHYQYDAIKTIKTSFMGALYALELAKRNDARILQASTSEIYGNPTVHPQTESYWGNVNPIGIRSCYDEGKRAAETLFFDYHRMHNIDIRVIRIFNTYGTKMCINDGRVVSNFIVQALRNEPLTIYGDGSQTRSLCYVIDLIDGMVQVMNYERENFTGPVNIGTQQELSMLDLAKKVIRLTGSESKIIFCDLPQDDPVRRKPCLDTLKSIIPWEEKVDIDEGLKKTIEYFKTII